MSITNKGRGYSIPPTVIIGSPGVGITATAVSGIVDGKLDYIRILNAGIGYTQAPTVSITGLSTVGVGTYVYNETITGESSGVTAVVRDFRTTISAVPGILPVTHIRVSLNTGKFSPGETIVGTISSARYTVLDYDTESYDNPYDTNEEIESEADDVIDFSESNPFGTY